MSELANKTMLSVLTISQWSARKFDKSATQKVLSEYSADSDAGRFNKKLINGETLKQLQKTASEARTVHYAMTLPWTDNGPRILPVNYYHEYCNKMRNFKFYFNNDLRVFISDYPHLKNMAKIALNGMFDDADYPDNVADKFSFDVSFLPIPRGSDFRIDLADNEVSEIASQCEIKIHDAEKIAIQDIYQRLHDTVKHVTDTLSNPDKIFRDSLIENMSNLINSLSGLNFTNDPIIVDLQTKIGAFLIKDPNALREDKKHRKETADNAKQILADIDSKLGV